MKFAIDTGVFDFPDFRIIDLKSEDTVKVILIITSLINGKTLDQFFPGFLFDCTKTPIDELGEVAGSGKVPMVFCLKNINYTAWISCKYSWLLDGETNQIIGFKFNEISNVTTEALQWRDREIRNPELWLEPFWPAIPLGNKKMSIPIRDETRPWSIIED